MDYIVIFVVGFFIGLVYGSGKKYVKDKHVSYYRENRNNDFQKANSNIEKYEEIIRYTEIPAGREKMKYSGG
ncbi:hypothetical protein LLB57_004254 [Escherichia coli]|nr:hypothetical protein [Escherichia coli]